MHTVAFYTLGCKVNQYETEAMTELFSANGYRIVDFNIPADIYIINTCTVTSMSDRKSRQIIRRAKKLNPDAYIAVAGCYAQTAPDTVLEIEGVNLVIGNNNRKNIVGLVEENMHTPKHSAVGDIMNVRDFEELSISTYSERTRAFIKVQEGCNQFCSYCIIPYARGPIRSRTPESIISEIKTLIKNGFTEVVLTGIHVASYGKDLKNTDLAELILTVNEIEGIERIRLSSIEPMTLNTDFINRIAKADKLCRHFHLSLQSGCDETLKRMNRKYTTFEYKKIVDSLRENFPDVAITTDIMVGFPYETDEEFEKTLKFTKEIAFADAHIFQYSPRKGTRAAEMTEQIPPEIKEKRSKALIKLCEETRSNFLGGFLGKSYPVLFEQPTSDGYFEGKTDNYITVLVPSTENLSGKFCMVEFEYEKDGKIYGRLKGTVKKLG